MPENRPNQNNNRGPQIAVGDIIWRPLYFAGGRSVACIGGEKRISVVQFGNVFVTDDGKGDPVVRVYYSKQYQRFQVGDPKYGGMVCFLSNPLPEDWTHMEVIRMGRSGKFIVAEARKAPPEAYFQRIGYKLRGKTSNNSFEIEVV